MADILTRGARLPSRRKFNLTPSLQVLTSNST